MADSLTPEHRLLVFIGGQPQRNKKKEMLEKFKASTKLKNIFLYSLDPFKKYFIKQFPAYVQGDGTEVIGPETWEVLDKLASRKVSGSTAKAILFEYISRLTQSEAFLLKKIVLHKLNIGVAVGTVNLVWPNLIAERFVQKAEDYDSGQLVLPSYAGLKLDGIRADYKAGVFTTRSGHTLSGLDHIRDYIQSRGGGHWDGELLVPKLDASFDAVSGYLRSGKTAKPLARYVVFDNLSIASLKQRIRLESLSVFTLYVPGQAMNNAPASFLRHRLFDTEDQIMAHFSSALRAGHEGLMIKHPRARYRAGRTYNWMKLKKGGEKEYEIVDYYNGEGRLSETLGGIVVQTTPNTTTRVGSGFSDEARNEIWADPTKILGSMATIAFMEETKDGSLRHPVYKTIRWDI